MRLLLVAAAVLAVASCASISLEDLEFHAWKLKFGKKKYSLVVFYLNAIYYLVCVSNFSFFFWSVSSNILFFKDFFFPLFYSFRETRMESETCYLNSSSLSNS